MRENLLKNDLQPSQLDLKIVKMAVAENDHLLSVVLARRLVTAN
jgi:hypothetical protein